MPQRSAMNSVWPGWVKPIAELDLGDRRGHQRASRAGVGQADRQLQRVERAARAGEVGLAKHDLAGIVDLDQRQGKGEAAGRIGRGRDAFDRAAPDRFDRALIAHREEGQETMLDPGFPGLGHHFRADPGRIPQCNREWRHRTALWLTGNRPPRRVADRADIAWRGG
jgi:hypothetical protein